MHLRVFVGALGLVWILDGCTDEPGSAMPEDECRERCIADPLAHFVCIDGCRTDSDCPGGFVCSGQEEEGGLGRCGPPQELSTPSALLIDGFGVAEMPGALERVEPVEGEGVRGAELSWRAPPGARVVHCALFVCAPRIVGRRIVDYERCAIADKTVERSADTERMEGSFSLYDEENQRGAEPSPGICGATTAPEAVESRYAVTELLAGCWAYDEVELVATTSLLRPSAEQVFDFYGILARGESGTCLAEGEDLGRSCARADGTFGACTDDGVCARRCLRQEDCEPLGDAEAEPGELRPMAQCESLEGELIDPGSDAVGGVCRPIDADGATRTSADEGGG